ncbi:unnamed protein product [Phytophthora lilii]|uniref:Unnamed protein product n=1 Tax=Phytophthora lilii TaxID=2077276 RepID=A0A9W6WPZ9_9STRA|nr:unnamed protein product [Phytophthora lilii]
MSSSALSELKDDGCLGILASGLHVKLDWVFVADAARRKEVLAKVICHGGHRKDWQPLPPFALHNFLRRLPSIGTQRQHRRLESNTRARILLNLQVYTVISLDHFARRRPSTFTLDAPLQRSVKGFGKTLPVDEIRLDVTYHCNLCGVATRLDTKTTAGKLLCQGCRRSELQRQSSLEDIRPASPMAGKPKALHPVKTDGRVHPSWMLTEVESEAETAELSSSVTTEHLHSFRAEDAGSFRSMEVLTCFRAEVHRGLRLLLKATTAEKWHMWWAMLLSMLLLPMILTLMVMAGVGFLVLSTWVAIVGVVVYPLAYINPRLDFLFNVAINAILGFAEPTLIATFKLGKREPTWWSKNFGLISLLETPRESEINLALKSMEPNTIVKDSLQKLPPPLSVTRLGSRCCRVKSFKRAGKLVTFHLLNVVVTICGVIFVAFMFASMALIPVWIAAMLIAAFGMFVVGTVEAISHKCLRYSGYTLLVVLYLASLAIHWYVTVGPYALLIVGGLGVGFFFMSIAILRVLVKAEVHLADFLDPTNLTTKAHEDCVDRFEISESTDSSVVLPHLRMTQRTCLAVCYFGILKVVVGALSAATISCTVVLPAVEIFSGGNARLLGGQLTFHDNPIAYMILIVSVWVVGATGVPVVAAMSVKLTTRVCGESESEQAQAKSDEDGNGGEGEVAIPVTPEHESGTTSYAGFS